MEHETGWLKRSLEEASKNVAEWPQWKRSLESATTDSQLNSILSISTERTYLGEHSGIRKSGEK